MPSRMPTWPGDIRRSDGRTSRSRRAAAAVEIVLALRWLIWQAATFSGVEAKAAKRRSSNSVQVMSPESARRRIARRDVQHGLAVGVVPVGALLARPVGVSRPALLGMAVRSLVLAVFQSCIPGRGQLRSVPRHAARSMVGRRAPCPGSLARHLAACTSGRAQIVQTAFTSRAARAAGDRRGRRHPAAPACITASARATCPTYVLFRDENNSPRGRIDLIRAMLEKGGAPDDQDRASPRSLPVLPVLRHDLRRQGGLRPSHRHRAAPISRSNYRRPLGERMLRRMLAELLALSAAFCAALRLAKLARPFAGSAAPRACAIWSSWRPAADARLNSLRRQSFRPKAQRRLRVALLRGLRAAGARSRHQCCDHSAAAAARLRGRDRAGRRLLRRAAAAYGPRGRRARRWRARNVAAWSARAGSAASMRSSSMPRAAAPRSRTTAISLGGDARHRRIGALDARRHRDSARDLGLQRRRRRAAIASPITMPARCSTASA